MILNCVKLIADYVRLHLRSVFMKRQYTRWLVSPFEEEFWFKFEAQSHIDCPGLRQYLSLGCAWIWGITGVIPNGEILITNPSQNASRFRYFCF